VYTVFQRVQESNAVFVLINLCSISIYGLCSGVSLQRLDSVNDSHLKARRVDTYLLDLAEKNGRHGFKSFPSDRPYSSLTSRKTPEITWENRNLQQQKKRFTVQVFFNVFRPDRATGLLSPTDAKELLLSLNHGFRNSPFVFLYNGIKQHFNSAHSACEDSDSFMKAFKEGGISDLTVYLCDVDLAYQQSGKVLIMPHETLNHTLNHLDGILLMNPGLRPEDRELFSKMKQVFIHEVGHWLGLKHTFNMVSHLLDVIYLCCGSVLFSLGSFSRMAAATLMM